MGFGLIAELFDFGDDLFDSDFVWVKVDRGDRLGVIRGRVGYTG